MIRNRMDQRGDRSRRVRAWVCLTGFALGQFGPFAVAGGPAMIARPGMGISSLPLEVVAFDAPGFGSFAEAVNLASGNLYVSLDGFGNNNLRTGADDPTVTIGGSGWNYSAMRWLNGVYPYTNMKSAVRQVGLLSGDGSGVTYERVDDPDFGKAPLKDAPSWIQRYKNTVQNVMFLKSRAVPGIQYSESWLVIVPRASDRTIAHVYAHDGARTTYGRTGKYPDYSQTLHQQYQSAATGDPEGESERSPKTAYRYLDAQSGLLTEVRDAWGRTTTYDWDRDTRRLQGVNFLLADAKNPASAARTMRFEYQKIGAWWYVTQVTHSAPDGLGGTASRRVKFEYRELGTPDTYGYRVLLTSSSREVLGGAGWATTIYSYDAVGRITGVSQVGGTKPGDPKLEPDLSYAYSSDSEFQGLKVTVTQGAGQDRKERVYHFDSSSLLRRARVWDHSPVAISSANAGAGASGSGRWLTYDYEYLPNGSTAAVSYPGGKRVRFAYDGRGNLTLKSLSAGESEVRAVKYEYDADNRVVAEVTPATSGEGYRYAEVRRTHTATNSLKTEVRSDGLPGAQAFSAPAAITHALEVDGKVQNSLLETLDESGRVISSVRSGVGQTRTMTFKYADGSAAQIPGLSASGDLERTKGVSARQYGDLVAARTVEGVETTYRYNALGDVALETVKNGFVSGFDKDKPQTEDRSLLRSFNGYGQQIGALTFTQRGETVVPFAKSMSVPYQTGETRFAWEGNPENVTAYRYEKSGEHLGRLNTQTKGAGYDATQDKVVTPRQEATFAYDPYGRLASRRDAKAETATTYLYDTLNRPVREARANGLTVNQTYAENGAASLIETVDASAKTTITQQNTLDALGRSLVSSVTAGDESYSLRTVYDAFDRPLRVTDSRLTMDKAGRDQTSYRVYDSLGNLTKALEPALATDAPGAYRDERRPYTEFVYDGFGRRVEQKRLLEGGVSPEALTLDARSNLPEKSVASTKTVYDAFDRASRVTDPAGYATEYAYDGLGDRIEQRRQIWTGNEPGFAALAKGQAREALTRSTFDGAGRTTSVIDPLGQRRQTSYTLLGAPLTERNERGIVTKVYAYTPDGLLEKIAEPITANDPNSLPPVPVGFGAEGAIPQGYTLTTQNVYAAGSALPTKRCQALMDNPVSLEQGCTAFSYDATDHPTQMALPDGSTIEQRFNTAGQRVYRKDALGFETDWTFDAWGRPVSQLEKARSSDPKTVDVAAGLAGGLATRWTYDLAGNLLEKNDHGMVTKYTANSAGDVIAETRARTDQAGPKAASPLLRLYRLDGRQTAETSPSYEGSLRGAGGADLEGQPSVSSGHLSLLERNARGEVVREVSVGVAPGATLARTEYEARFTVNGLGQRVQRRFQGDPSIYASPARDGQASYETVWQYDLKGHLTAAWDQVGQVRYNSFGYAYSPSGQETRQTHDVRIQADDPFVAQRSQLLGASVAEINSQYDARDQLARTTVTDQAAGQGGLGQPMTRTTSYKYYRDGHPSRVEVEGVGYLEYRQYDFLGRATLVYDANGTTKSTALKPASASTAENKDALLIFTERAPDGTIRQRIDKAVAGEGSCLYQREVAVTLGARPVRVSEWNASVKGSACGVQPARTQTITYTDQGLPAKAAITSLESTGPTTWAQTYRYDAFGQRTSEARHYMATTADGARSGSESFEYHYAPDGFLTDYTIDRAVPGGQPERGAVKYALDARGDRLSQSSNHTLAPYNRFHAYQKRYDASGLVTEFWSPRHDNGSLLTEQALAFRYDPNGNPTVSADGFWKADKPKTGGQTPSTSTFTANTYNTLMAGDEIQLIRNAHPTLAGADRVKDNTFSLVDGIGQDAWQVLEPLETGGGLLTLEAPVKTLSARLGLRPLEVLPPGGTLGSDKPNPIAVTPPSSGPKTQRPAPSGGFSTPTVSANAASAPATGVSVLSLEPPQGSLPSATFGISASAVVAPSSATLSDRPDPTQVFAPNASHPTIGSTPSDTNPTVLPPSNTNPSNRPPLGPSSSPTDTKPPIGWQPPGQTVVKTQDWLDEIAQQPSDHFVTQTLTEELERLRQQQREWLGKDAFNALPR